MWKVYCDNYLLYSPELEDYEIFSPSLNLELNKTGSFIFTIYSNHPNYDKLKKLKSIVQVFQGDTLYFRGRILNDTVGFHNERKVSCEGELAFLLDSVQRPFKFPATEGDPATPEDYFKFLLNRHNAQVGADHQFAVGTVSVTDPNNYISRSDSEYSSTWQLVKEGLIGTHGGYVWIDTDDNGKRRINYLSDFSTLGNQPVEFGKNLLDILTERKGEDVATAILPLGKADKETNERVTISGIADEETDDICKSGDFVYSKAAEALYGYRITKVVTWDDVTQASNLLRKAREKLSNSVLQEQTTEFSAADLSAAGYDFNSFRLGTYITAKSEPHSASHGLTGMYLVKKLSINLLNPAANKLTAGATVYTFTEQNKRDQETKWQEVQANVEKNQSQAIRELEQRTNSAILQNSESILSRVSEGYYTKDQTNTKVSELSTEIEQTASGIEVRFSNLQTDLDKVEDGANAQFTEIKSFIRLEDGNVIIGLADNTFKQILSAKKNSFFEGAVEVAYISNKKMYITDGEFTNSLQLGKFAFIPRANGNTSFKKVVD
jgi:hypothetical protein